MISRGNFGFFGQFYKNNVGGGNALRAAIFLTTAKAAVIFVIAFILSIFAVYKSQVFVSTKLFQQAPAEKNVTEITFQYFLTHVLTQQRVERVDIVNWEMAKVFILQSDDNNNTSHQQTKESSFQDDDLNTLAEEASLSPYIFRIGTIDSFYSQLHSFQSSMGRHQRDFVPVKHVIERKQKSFFVAHRSEIVTVVLHLILLIAFNQTTISKRMKPLNRTRNHKSGIMFSDVAGMKEAKNEIKEFVDFLKDPKKYQQLGAVIPKGALLVGPPGTGKTLLAKAIAGEANVPFYSVSGSDFVEELVGVGASRMRDLFQEAQQQAPSIIFIDEIDSIGRRRNSASGQSRGTNDERENTLNQMLVEMDGFSTSSGVVVLAGTNRADILDPALTRPGRFDRTIHIEKPDLSERTEIFKVHMKPLKLDSNLDSEETNKRLAALTPGFVGADIRNVCNEAAIYAARRNASGISIEDFEDACERVLGGMKKSTGFINADLRRVIAFHEAGHAVAGWFLKYGDPVLKVSIVPRTNGALGFSQNLPEEVQLMSREEVWDKIAVLLGGRVSEELNIGRISTGAADDLQKVTALVFASVREWGFASSGLLAFPNHGSDQFYKPYSDHMAQLMDKDACTIINEQYDRVKDLLTAKSDLVHRLADRLLEQETVTFTDLIDVLGKRPFPFKDGYGQYMAASPKNREIKELKAA